MKVEYTRKSYYCHFFLIIFDLVFIIVLQGKKDLVAVDSTEYEDENGDMGDSENEEPRETQQDSSSDVDSDEERRRFFFFFSVPYLGRA